MSAAATDEVVLHASSVSKRYPGVLALDDARFRVRAGSIQALVGKNGAGKSTLMGVLAGQVRPDAGEVHVSGRPTHAAGPADMEREGIVLVPQHANLFAELSVLENLLIPGRYPHRAGVLVDWPAARSAARRALGVVGLAISEQERAGDLSAGVQRLVMIARALARRPRVLILDEPTESFTEDEVERLFGLLRDLVAGGIAVVYVSHRLEEVLAIADEITVMRDGRAIADVVPDETTHEGLVELIVGAPASVEAASAPAAAAAAGLARRPVLEIGGLRAERVRGVDLHVGEGEIVGLYGPLGSGRSDVLRTVAGLHDRTDGEVRVEGENLPAADVAAAVARHVVYIPEDRRGEALFPDLSVRENVSIAMGERARRTRGLPLLSKRREAAAARQILDVVRFDRGELEQPVETLSGGTQQKVVLARALSREPVVWLLDEPLVGLDIATRREFFRIIRDRVDDRGGVLVVLSDYEDLELMCDRVYTMREGAITGEFARGAMSEEQLMHAVSFAPPTDCHLNENRLPQEGTP